jgi:hypothetical protein
MNHDAATVIPIEPDTTMAINNKTTSTALASRAGRVLSDATASDTAKSLAASALSQCASGHQTGAAMEALAARVLDSRKYNKTTHSLAGSVLSQANKAR